MRDRHAEVIEESAAVEVRCAPAIVWNHVADLTKTPTWRTNVADIEPPEKLEVGQQFTGTTRLLGRTWRWVLELTEIEDGRRLAYAVVRGVVKPHVVYDLEAIPGGTRFTMTGRLEQLGIAGRILEPLARPALRRETAAHLENLRALLEDR